MDRTPMMLAAGRHTFGAATTCRQNANRPQEAFTATLAARPGEQVQLDATPLDVLAVMDDKVIGRVELVAAIDVATRTVCAAVLRPVGTKAVDVCVGYLAASGESSKAIDTACHPSGGRRGRRPRRPTGGDRENRCPATGAR
jgi:hypothetical protein